MRRPRAWRSALLFGLLLLAAAVARAERAEVRLVDRVVAVVQGEVITLSRVNLEARIQMVKRAGGEAGRVVRITPGLRSSVLELMINQRVIHAEAERLRFLEIDREERARLLQEFQQRCGGEEAMRGFLAEQEVTEAELVEILARARRVELYIEERIGLAARPSEDELRRLWTGLEPLLGGRDLRPDHPALAALSFRTIEDAARFLTELESLRGQDFAAARAVLEPWLYQVRFRVGLEEWLKQLRSRSQVRIVGAPLGPGPGTRAVAPGEGAPGPGLSAQ